MRKNDARKLKYNELTELRKRGISAVQDGQPVKVVAQVLGVHRSTLFGWLAQYRRGGWDGLDAHERGGRPPKLTAKMLQWIYDAVTKKDPRQMKFPFALWTALMIGEMIWRQYGIRLSEASVCRLLN
jgi:transposase